MILMTSEHVSCRKQKKRQMTIMPAIKISLGQKLSVAESITNYYFLVERTLAAQ